MCLLRLMLLGLCECNHLFYVYVFWGKTMSERGHNRVGQTFVIIMRNEKKPYIVDSEGI